VPESFKTDTTISHYRILAKIGEGGMGEVYRARDARLDREVAIKVLPASFASAEERLRRFEQEARATSALNHPNILTIYDIGTQDGAPYIVSELLEGEELRDQLNEGPLPQRKAIDYARQIASGLSAAHERGIVHRDLKPENIFVTREGRVKILDFGLAKLKPMRAVGEVGSELPTKKALTDPGTVMGTVGYMSPEQVRGQETDHRTDIFSFGAILYEMLSGRRAFHSDTMAETMTAILREEPEELTETNTKINPALEKIVQRCLEKKPERRFRSTSDLGFALEALSTPSGSRLEATAFSPVAGQSAVAWQRWKWAAIALAAVALVVLGWLALRPQPSSGDMPVTWLEIGPPHERFAVYPAPAISPDGRQIAFWAPDETGKDGLWVRSLDSPTARLLPGTTGYSFGVPPFWSPDGRSLGFFVDGRLKRIDLAGGTPLTLANAAEPRGGSWSADGVIIFVPAAAQPVHRVPASGGEATPLPLAPIQSADFVWPHLLPDGRHFLVTIRGSGIYVATLDAQEARQISKVESRAEYAGGYLFFGQTGSLFAQAFDEKRLALSGEPVRVVESLGFSFLDLSAFAFSVSSGGTLVYWSGTALPITQLTWFSRRAERLDTLGEPGEYGGFDLSPTGQQLVLERHDAVINEMNLWLMDATTGVGSKFTSGPSQALWKAGTPVWSPTGDRVFFVTFPGLASQPLRGGDAEKLFEDFGWLMDVSPDGHYALFQKNDPVTGLDLWLYPLIGDKTPGPYLVTKNSEGGEARFSPDGRWIVYVSGESGGVEVYVNSFPEPGRPVRVSTKGGVRPEWRSDGKEIYYIWNKKLFAAAVNGGGAIFQASSPQPLFPINESYIGYRTHYHASADGSKFLVNSRVEDTEPRVLHVLLNWQAALKR
jgi:serine/threonine protein kinase